MKAMEDGNTNSLVKMCNEDIALCESIVRAEEWLRINDRIEEERVLKKLQVEFQTLLSYQRYYHANLMFESISCILLQLTTLFFLCF